MNGPTTTSPANTKQADKIKSLLASYYESEDNDDSRDYDIRYGCVCLNWLYTSKMLTVAVPCFVLCFLGVAYSGSLCMTRIRRYEDHDIITDGDVTPDEDSGPSEESLDTLLNQCRLDELLAKEKELSNEVGNIDIELRNVVYDSYSNFITASDVVKNLKGALENADEQLQALDSLVSQIVSQSETIDSKLNEQQDAIFQMNQSRLLLQKLTSLLRVPKTMKVAIERGAYEVAADIYLDTKGVLEKYSEHHKVLREIRDDVEIYKSQAVEALRARLLKSSEAAAPADLVILLAKLGEPTASLIDIYLSSQMTKVKTEIENIDSAFQTMESLAQIVDSLQGSLETLFVTILSGTVRLSYDIFDQNEHIVVFVKTSIDALLDRIQTGILTKCQETLASIGGFDTSGLELDQTFSTVEILNKEDVLEIEYIYSIIDDLRRRSLDLDTLIPEAQAVHSLHLTVQTILETHIKLAFVLVGGRVFRSIKEIIMKIVLNTTAEDDSNSYRFLKVHMKAIDVGLRQDFGIIRSCAMTWILQDWMQKQWIDVVLESISNSWRGIMLYLASRMGAIVGLESSYATLVPGFIERQFAIPGNLENPCIMYLYLSSQIRHLQTCLHARAEDLYKGIYLVSPHRKEAMSPGQVFLSAIPEATEMVEQFMEQYIESRKNALHVAMHDSFKEIVHDTNDTPVAPSSAAMLIIQAVTNIHGDFLNTGADDIDGEGHATPSSLNSAIWTILEFYMEREIHVIQSATKISKFAFQQIQIDSHVIKSRVSKYIEDAKRLSSMFDTLPITAAEYCDDPILLDPISLDKALV